MQWALGAIATLIFVSAITPGPNNLIVLGRASARGVASVAPAVSGIVAGGIVMIALAKLGLAAFFVGNAWVLKVVAWIGCAYLARLGVSLIANAHSTTAARDPAISRADAIALFAFQFANPKAWVLVTTMVAASATNGVETWPLLALFAAISSMSLLAWALLGKAMQRWRQKPRVRMRFDQIMALSLLLSTIVLAVEQW